MMLLKRARKRKTLIQPRLYMQYVLFWVFYLLKNNTHMLESASNMWGLCKTIF